MERPTEPFRNIPPQNIHSNGGSFGSIRHRFNNCFSRDRIQCYHPVSTPIEFSHLPSMHSHSPFVSHFTPSSNYYRAHPTTMEDDLTRPIHHSTSPKGNCGVGQQHNEQTGEMDCACNISDGSTQSRRMSFSSTISLAANAYDVASRYHRVPALSPASKNPSLGWRPLPADNRDSSGSETLGAGDLGTNITRVQTTPSNSVITSTVSTSSSNHLYPSITITEKRSRLLNTLYYTCLEASISYLNSIPPVNHRHRYPLQRQGICHGRYRPYSPNRSLGVGSVGRQRPVSRSSTLMDNISKISTRLWRKARCNVMAPHREEAETVKVMRNLYAWGEVVVHGMESDGYTLDDTEGGSGLENMRGDYESNTVSLRAGYAARNICEWLGNYGARNTCGQVIDQLVALKEEESNREIPDVSDEFDSIS